LQETKVKILRRGSRGIEVEYLQRLLNKDVTRDRSARSLVVDGIFGETSHAAVRNYQERHQALAADGIVGNNTWRALGLIIEKEHPRVILFGQPTGTSCWSAAATMILGNQSVGPGGATLTNSGTLRDSMQNLQTFSRSLGWQMINHSPTVLEMVRLVQRTPVWIGAGGSNWGHAVVLSGVYSDGDSRGEGTIFRIHDPWPQGRGRIYGSFANPITFYGADNVTRVPASLEVVMVPC